MTLLNYSPRGQSEIETRSRYLLGSCKNGKIGFARNVARKIIELNANTYFANAALVPIPRSTPIVTGAVFPSKVLAEVFVNESLGNVVYECLSRVTPINRSSNNYTAQTRNTVRDHINTLSVSPILITEPTIILIDDVFTLGRTAMASALKLKEVYPEKEIKVFCPFRTRSLETVDRILSLEMHKMELSNDGNGVRLPD